MMIRMEDGNMLGGWLPDEPGMEAPQLTTTEGRSTPSLVDLRASCSPVEDQGREGSCVANAIVGALEYQQIRQGLPVRDLSRLFVYYNARRLGERIGQGGTYVHRAMAAVLGFGVCPASMWPYQPAMTDEQPTDDCYQAALSFRTLQFARTDYGLGAREALANDLPVILTMLVAREDFGRARTSGKLIPRGNGQWEEPASGHAMLIVGYDDDKNAWLVRNSWGPGWGDGGHVWIDYDYLHYYTNSGSYAHAPYVIGNIESSSGLGLSGPSMQEMMAQFAGSTEQLRAQIGGLRHEIASELDSSLSQSKQSIRDRLRGPGAGGGYNKGPGAGGGY